jgi:hypothetical protein
LSSIVDHKSNSKKQLGIKPIIETSIINNNNNYIKNNNNNNNNNNNKKSFKSPRKSISIKTSNSLETVSEINIKSRNKQLFDINKLKSEKRKTLKELIQEKHNSPQDKKYINNINDINNINNINNITCKSASTFEFRNLNIEIIESREIIEIYKKTKKIGIEEMMNCLIKIGADIKLLKLKWVTNHYKWIIWKLSSTERFFPNLFLGKYLTVDNVLKQLCYRYQREINNSNRSSLTKIYEKDESPSKLIILCVSSINNENKKITLELTDGWYSINTIIDIPLQNLVLNGKIFIGQKLQIIGAQLKQNENGISPLDDNSSFVNLIINYNGTKRAKNWQKLGFQKYSSSLFSVNLKSISNEGGIIPKLNIIIQKIYPILFLETLQNGSKIIRSQDQEISFSSKHEVIFFFFSHKNSKFCRK